MERNICRCGCYPRIKQAILSVAEQAQSGAVQMAIPVAAEAPEGIQS
jgi:hypothetical protein